MSFSSYFLFLEALLGQLQVYIYMWKLKTLAPNVFKNENSFCTFRILISSFSSLPFKIMPLATINQCSFPLKAMLYSSGEWLCGFSRGNGTSTSWLEEIWALRDGLTIASELHIENFIIKLDVI